MCPTNVVRAVGQDPAESPPSTGMKAAAGRPTWAEEYAVKDGKMREKKEANGEKLQEKRFQTRAVLFQTDLTADTQLS